MASAGTSTRPNSRIPAALQAVFLASNQGKAVHKAPKGVANKVFVRHNNGGSTNNKGARWQWWRRLGRSRKSRKDRSKGNIPPAAEADYTESTTGSDHDQGGAAMAPIAVASSSDSSAVMAETSPARTSSLSSVATPAAAPSSRCFYGSMATRNTSPPSPRTEEEQAATLPLEIQFRNLDVFVPDAANQRSSGKVTGSPGGSALARALAAATRNQEEVEIPPQEFLENLLQKRGYSTSRFPSLQTAYFNPPTPLQKASYGSFLVDAVREDDVEQVSDMLSAGLSPNPANSHGETLLHFVAKHGQADMMQVLLDYGASVQCVDDLGRSPLHEACWSDRPSWPVVDLLLGQDPWLLALTDSRGATPLSYVPRSEWRAWTLYLEEHANVYWPSASGGTPTEPTLAVLKPGQHPLSDPSDRTALPVKVAKLLSEGRLTPNEVRWLVQEEDDSSSSDESSFDDCMSDSACSEDEYYTNCEDDGSEQSM